MDSYITWPYQIADQNCRITWVYNKIDYNNTLRRFCICVSLCVVVCQQLSIPTS